MEPGERPFLPIISVAVRFVSALEVILSGIRNLLQFSVRCARSRRSRTVCVAISSDNEPGSFSILLDLISVTPQAFAERPQRQQCALHAHRFDVAFERCDEVLVGDVGELRDVFASD